MSGDIIIRVEGAWGIITLNRPAALNSLTQEMCGDIDAALARWDSDPAVKAVLVEGEGERAFCAGGDIKSLAAAAARDPVAAADFFRTEYRMNVRVHRFSKPYVALLDGVTMGGGVGISMSASHRIATDRTVWAMPECMIGLVPDVGASWLLPRLKTGLGAWLGLTGQRLGAADLLTAGLATHHVPAASLDKCRAMLLELPLAEDPIAEIGLVLSRHHVGEDGQLVKQLGEIARLFGDYGNVSHLITMLQSDSSSLASTALGDIAAASPTSLALTHRLLANVPESFEACISREFCVTSHCLAAHDFGEGVRAQIIDKDRAPKWLPASLAEIDASHLAAYFEPPPGGPLDLSGF
ncbi:MAG: enoyl-CoA hydratase/isomerase family protein [Parvularcula sp.]